MIKFSKTTNAQVKRLNPARVSESSRRVKKKKKIVVSKSNKKFLESIGLKLKK